MDNIIEFIVQYVIVGGVIVMFVLLVVAGPDRAVEWFDEMVAKIRKRFKK